MVEAIKTINLATILGGIGLVVMSLWPGFAGGCWIFLALPLIALLGLAWLLVAMIGYVRHRNAPSLRQLAVAPILVCLTLALLVFYIPRRIAFLAHRGPFEKHVASVRANGYPTERPGWIGIYRVDMCVTDPRGGVYFRTGTGPDGIGPDTVSYGFVYRPNRKGSPFGASGYRVRRLGGEWYWFEASDDSY